MCPRYRAICETPISTDGYVPSIDSLSPVAGGLLVIGGVSRGLFQAVPMGELAGMIANLIPTIAIFTELFASHYREQK